MTFDDLPPDWPTRPLHDARLVADVLDLVVSEQARDDGALVVLCCDAADRLRTPVQIDAPEAGEPLASRATMLATLCEAVAGIEPDAGVLLAVARRGGLSVTADDRCWAEAAVAAAAGRVRLLGVHVVTPDGSRPVPADRAA
jgi:hypothetical protein